MFLTIQKMITHQRNKLTCQTQVRNKLASCNSPLNCPASTPAAPLPILYCLMAIIQGVTELGLLDQPLNIVHGSTVATNAALEGKGVRTSFITHYGLGADNIEIRPLLDDELAQLKNTRTRLKSIPPTPRNSIHPQDNPYGYTLFIYMHPSTRYFQPHFQLLHHRFDATPKR